MRLMSDYLTAAVSGRRVAPQAPRTAGRSHRWKKTELLVRNNSASHIPQVKVTNSGPAVVIPREIVVELPPHSEVLHDVSIVAEEPGEVPFRSRCCCPIMRSSRRLRRAGRPPPTYIWLESAPE
jgi:hypothetical protein